MRIKTFLLLSLLPCLPSQSAPIADAAALADTLNAAIGSVPGSSGSSETVESRPNTVLTGGSESRSDAHRRAVRQNRRVRAAARDSARRLDNIYIGSASSFALLGFDLDRDTSTLEFAPSQGLLFGYRTHLGRLYGFKTGLQYRVGPTLVTRSWPDTVGFPFDNNSADGASGATQALDAQAQLILGPVLHVVAEPGIAYGFGWHTASRIMLDNADGNRMRYEPARRYTTLSATMGFTLYLGARDQINPTWGITVGKVLGERFGLNYQGGAGFVYAFQAGP